MRVQRTQQKLHVGGPRLLVALLLVLAAGCGEERSSSPGSAAEVVQTPIGSAPAVAPTQLPATPTSAPPSPIIVPTPAAETATAAAATANGTLVDIGGYRLYLRCTGAGSPTVVLDAGLNETSASWVDVQPSVAAFTRVCSYDRAGRGQSDPGPAPRTSQRIATELHTALLAAGEAGPYILAGHSFGGLNMRIYASMYPDDVVGLVLVDALPDLDVDRFRAELSPQETTQLNTFLQENDEGVDIEASLREARAIGSLDDLPLHVLTHGQPDATALGLRQRAAEVELVWQLGQRALARLSTQSTVVVAEGSGHAIQQEQPALVVAAIQQIISQAR